jgi:hypothetical protein
VSAETLEGWLVAEGWAARSGEVLVPAERLADLFWARVFAEVDDV